jgi:FtsP/CotA-like multicopper oxidase with cupredoxin domain
MATMKLSVASRVTATLAAAALVLAAPTAAHATARTAPAATVHTGLSTLDKLAPLRGGSHRVSAPLRTGTTGELGTPRGVPSGPPGPPQGPLPQTGCTLAGTTASCDLWAKPGTVVLPGAAAPVPIWGFASTDAAAATLPGPVLVVDQGDTVTITIHNGLTDNLSLGVPAVTGVAPDQTGAAPGATATYTFTASRPGTYTYEAGHTPDGARQVAMGLVGALVVRAPAVAGRPSAYGDAGSTYDDEAVLVLTEVDPAFNAAPLSYDLRSYSPKYRLINGKAFPETDLIATDVSRTVLLRYVDAGLLAHPMTLLGVSQTVLGRDARPSAYPENAVTVPLQPGQAVDSVVSVPAGPDGRMFALMESGGGLNNAGQRYGAVVPGVSPIQAFGGMLTFLDTNPPPASGDHIGPVSSGVSAAPNPASVLNPVTVTANFSDVLNGNSTVDAAEVVVDDLSVAEGTGIPFSSAGFGTGPTVTGATATIPTATLTTLTQGRHTLYVRAHDLAGNWGVVAATSLTLAVTGAVTTGLGLSPTPTTGTGDVALTATGDDSGLGGTITAAEYFVDASGVNGTGTALTLGTTGTAITAETATIPAVVVAALTEGRHSVLVHTQDSFGLWGPYASIDLVIDRTMPTLLAGSVDPQITNGTNGSASDPTDIRVNASFTDPVSNAVNTPIAGAEGFLDTPGANGAGFTFLALDGAFNSPTESAYALVPLSEVTALADGVHQMLVHARDAAGNWGPLTAVTFTVDKSGPVVSNLTATPNPVPAGVGLTLTATAVDALSTVAGGEWFDGADPGSGHGTAMTVAAGTLSAGIAAGTLAAGPHTLQVRARDALGNWGAAGSVTVTVQAPANAIFADAFSSLNTSAWSQTVGTPSAASGALVAAGVSYVVDNTPAAERSLHVKFDVSVGTYNAGTATVDLFQARDATNAAVVRIQLRRSGANNQVRLGLFRAGAWAYSAWTTITGATVTLHLDWSSATAGSAALAVGATTVGTLTGNTSASVVESAALGLVARTNTTPTGSATFDNYVSTRFTAP